MTTADPKDSLTASQRARRAQREAADPLASAWVSANAGTGKTQVLTDRILRLLLAGTKPERILALTYTKAAAAEMAKRVFDRLSSWVTAPDTKLDEALHELMGRGASLAERTLARQLFAAAIETPGGLKVQTIHAFSERLLQRFPLEAGVPPGFSILDDRTAAALRTAATDDVLGEAALLPQSPLGRALHRIIAYAVDTSFDSLMREALGKRDWLASLSTLVQDDVEDQAHVAYRTLLDIPAGSTRLDLASAVAGALSDSDASQAHAILARGGKSEIKYADLLAAVVNARSDAARLSALRDLFLTSSNGPRAPAVNAATLADYPNLKQDLVDARDRFMAAEARLRALDMIDATLALARIADAIMTRYAAAKSQRAGLDFDDLIRKAQQLLGPSSAVTSTAAWVLFKLDGGLDHILVDEAQDTSRAQWSLIQQLAGEFYAGGSRDDIIRTLFAVGDEKQSIYGFQGAQPKMFAEMGDSFAADAVAAGRLWRRVPLNVSFRTTQPVLEAVDRVFSDPLRTPGLTAQADPVHHVAHRALQAGLVELWPVETPADAEPINPWTPLAEKPVSSPVSRLANRIADTIQHWLQTGERLASENRPLRPGDVLVLVAKRRPFAPAMVAALKARDIPVAGADRLKLTDQIGVQDLIALGDFLVLPEDDLALATILKSPLFGLDDDALMAIAPQRKGTLWQALLARAESDPTFHEAATRLRAWRSEADFLPPYEFFAGLLERDNGLFRRRLLERLGTEAADPIDEFLNLALVYDEQEPPSLQGYLTWLRGAEHEIKRDMDQGRNEVRVMTVHGAKGLEAPIVFLPDTCGSGRGMGSALVKSSGESRAMQDLQFWPIKGSSDLDAIKLSKDEKAARDAEERNRLLYVALTRPRDRLYVAGYTNSDKLPAACWYQLIEAAIKPAMIEIVTPLGPVFRLEQAQLGANENPRHQDSDAVTMTTRPDWATAPAPREPSLTVPLAPSRLAPLETDDVGDPIERPRAATADPAALPPGISSDTRRFLRGTLTHALLQHLPTLPRAEWERAAKAFLDQRGVELPVKMRASIARETLVILTHPRFATLFGPDSQAEVPLVAEIPRPSGIGPPLKIFGQIDRLAREGDVVRLIDYKTNRPPPLHEADVAEAYLLQLAAYRLALARIFPGCSIECAIVWTDGAHLMEIDRARIDGAETRLWQLDVVRRT